MIARRSNGFTLIEVLIALAILAIALTALIRSSTESVMGTRRVKEKNTAHLVAMQGLALIELGFVPIHAQQTITQKMLLFNQSWYWRAKVTSSSVNKVEKITITTSPHAHGPFVDPMISFRAKPHEKN